VAVCERHPRLRLGFLGPGAAGIAPWLDRMDRHFDGQGLDDSGLNTRPSEVFQRNCGISFEPVEGGVSVLADYTGPHRITWAIDYPHSDGFFPPGAADDRQAAQAIVSRGEASGIDRGRDALYGH
jgi:uncharacterized protein